MAVPTAGPVSESWTENYIWSAIMHSVPARERLYFLDTTSIAFISTFVLLLISSIYILSKYILKMATSNHPPSKPFPFLDLPAELREMVYENLLEDPYYPAREACPKHAGTFASYFAHQWGWQIKKMPEERKSNWIFLANRQTYEEYMALLARKATFFLTVSPENYTHPKVLVAPGFPSPAPAPVEAVTHVNETSMPAPASVSPSTFAEEVPRQQSPLWKIAPTTLARVRRCSLKLITTSAMLGVTDPRTLIPGSWDLAHQVQHELRNVQNVKELNLHVKAVGDPLWNPMWVWYHAMTSFFNMGEHVDADASVSDEKGDEAIKEGSGPRISKILFSLDTWSPGENYLARNAEGKWGWYCIKDHRVHEEAGVDLTVRQFCHRLYYDCKTCRPDAESEAEEGAAP